ncbi:MAG: 4'-phosphopantetheinyl transferase superfamily protein [Deltaproteobacteria bacterium]
MEPLNLEPTLFPGSVVAHALRLSAPTAAMLDRFHGVVVPEALAGAVLKRRVEFAAGRFCAREALRVCEPSLGGVHVGIGENREPRWPAGVVGAISHTTGYVAAAVARSEHVGGLGLDLERWMDSDAPERIGSMIVVDDELERLGAQTGWTESEVLTLVFSAKESVYKCLYPEVLRYFGFHCARVETIDLARGAFVARLTERLTDGLPAGLRLEGRFERREEVVVTALATAPRR